jgi:hypothetical protein
MSNTMLYRSVTLLVLDEADRLLELGFEEDIRTVQKLLGVGQRFDLTESRLWTVINTESLLGHHIAAEYQ